MIQIAELQNRTAEFGDRRLGTEFCENRLVAETLLLECERIAQRIATNNQYHQATSNQVPAIRSFRLQAE
jgi:hypothetical protein